MCVICFVCCRDSRLNCKKCWTNSVQSVIQYIQIQGEIHCIIITENSNAFIVVLTATAMMRMSEKIKKEVYAASYWLWVILIEHKSTHAYCMLLCLMLSIWSKPLNIWADIKENQLHTAIPMWLPPTDFVSSTFNKWVNYMIIFQEEPAELIAAGQTVMLLYPFNSLSFFLSTDW